MPDAAWWTLYNFLLLIGSPFLLLWLLYRKLFQGKGEGWGERTGFSPRSDPDRPAPVWIHAVSAGEVTAATPIVRALRQRLPDTPLVLSTITPAGREMAARLDPNDVSAVFFLPWDLLPCVALSLGRVRPRAVLLMEAEFWPNFLTLCRWRGIPAVVANGRISDKGYRRARKIERAMPWIYGLVTAFGMQGEEDARRAVALGAREERVSVPGQTKFDLEPRPLSEEETRALRSELALREEDRVLVGGSTRPGEEEALLELFLSLRHAHPGLTLLLAPRHLERLEEVETLARDRGLEVSRRTAPVPNAPVILLDTMGELGKIYAVGEVCFVGGTLADVGGHNLLQPVAQGKPVFFGPHVQNVRDIAALLIEEGVGFKVNNSAELERAVREALDRPEERLNMEERALRVVEANKGASERYVDLLLRALEAAEK